MGEVRARSGLTTRFDLALDVATALHRHQERKGTGGHATSYVSHLLKVAAIAMADDSDEDVAIAALLHDGPEDQGGRKTLQAIRQLFGRRVSQIVEACTDTMRPEKPEWLPRKRRFIRRLSRSRDKQVLLVKCADCLANGRDTLTDYRRMKGRVWSRFRSMPCATNQLWWYVSCRNELLGIRDTRAFAQFNEVVESLVQEVEPCRKRGHHHQKCPPVRALPA
jgi:(p)ppGpp synthase/HD superfamily hydrolase